MDTSICLILLLALIQRILATSYFEYHITHHLACETVDKPFFTRLNIGLPECVETCVRRSRCRAVSFNRKKKKCELLATEQRNAVRSTSDTACVYIKKMDIMIIPKEIAYGCEDCTINQTCGKDNKTCIITECLPLDVENAKILGNMVNVGSGIKIVPDSGYILSTNQSKSKCQENGTWSNVPTSIFPDCGDPPTISNAKHSGSNTSLGGQIRYECVTGYHVNDSTVDMKIKCRLNFSSTPVTINWSPAMFECLQDPCPPDWIEGDQSCYKFSDDRVSHDNAMEYCNNLGAHLVIIESQEENEFLKGHIDNYGTSTWWWIGIYDKEDEGNWVYTHTNKSITFDNWGQGSPINDNNRACADMNSVYGWSNWYCSVSNKFICEKAAVSQQ